MAVRSPGLDEYPLMLDALRRLGEAGIASLLEARPDLAEPPPRALTDLAARASGPVSVDACWQALDRGAQQVVEALCLLPTPTTVDALAAVLGVDRRGACEGAADLADVLHRLRARALVRRDGDRMQLLVKVDVRFPAGLGPPARVALASQSAVALDACAKRLRVRAGTTKGATLAAIADALSTPGLLDGLLSGAPADTAEIAARLAFEGPEGYASGTAYGVVKSEHTPVGWLANRGVLASTGWETVVMVGEAGLALRGGVAFPDLALRPPELVMQPVDLAAADRAAAERALRLVADVTTILDGWAADSPRQLKAGGLGIQVVRRLAKAIDRTEVETAQVIELAVAAGLVSIDDGTDAAMPLPAYDQWSDLDVARRWSHLVAAWARWDVHASLAGALDTKRKPIPPMLVRAPEPHAAIRRTRILATLAMAPPGQAASVESTFARATWDAPAVWAGGPASREMLAAWSLLECELLGVTGLGVLSTWGRRAVEGDFEGARAALDRVVPAVTAQFVVQADLTALAPAELVRSVQAELESMADLESRGAAVLYRFTETSVRRGYEAGRTSADILGFLEAHAARGVPQALTYLVNDVGRRFGQVRVVATACCLRTDDPALLAEVVASRPAKGLGLRLLAPTVAAASADAPTVVAALRSAGYAPAEEGSDGALVLRRPPRRRAVPDPRLAALARRRPGQSAAFGPVGDPFAPPTSPGPSTPTSAGARSNAAEAAARLLRSVPPPKAVNPPKPAKPAKPPPTAVNAPKPAKPAPKPPTAPPTAPAASKPASIAPALPFESLPPAASPFDLGSATRRPEHIARDPAAVAEILELALEEEWPVRMAYTNKKGTSTQLNVAILDVGRREVVVELLSGWDSRVLALSRVSWVRVLTEAEEDAL